MSTNYYMSRNFCEHCQRSEELHIGKVANDEFMFHEYDDIHSIGDWYAAIKTAHKIWDEYDHQYTSEEMIHLMLSRREGEFYSGDWS